MQKEDRFGKWEVIKTHASKDKFGRHFALCQCECGKARLVRKDSLMQGGSKGCVSCGATRHGHNPQSKRSGTYHSWWAMVSRCKYPSRPGYENYGGRGIKVCRQWMKFENFLHDMGVRPEGKSIDRVNNEKGYRPSNCRWASPVEQANNRRAA